MAIKTLLNYSPNFDSIKRKSSQIKFIIFHYTGMKSEKNAIDRLTNIKSQVSSHYLIKNNGDIMILVPDLYIAWHAGKSSWKNLDSLNKHSIGNNERWKTPLGARLSRDDIVKKLKAVFG